MHIGIDGSNIRAGGGITHLRNLLKYSDPGKYSVTQVSVWACANTLSHLEDRPWLTKRTAWALEKGAATRLLWSLQHQQRALREAGVDIVFAPGANYFGRFPSVSMSQNLLPFDTREMGRFAYGKEYWRYLLLRHMQGYSFRRAAGVVFLSHTAKRVVSSHVDLRHARTAMIPHGISRRFMKARERGYSIAGTVRILYVSIINFYKHQKNLVQAVGCLKRAGVDVELTLVGPAYGPALVELEKVIGEMDPEATFIRYFGAVSHEELPGLYERADIFAFPSTCENMPNVLLEAMALSMPIACSNKEPMPEVLGDAGVYFDAESPQSIQEALMTLIQSEALRRSCGEKAHAKAAGYSWEACADATFEFLADTVRRLQES